MRDFYKIEGAMLNVHTHTCTLIHVHTHTVWLKRERKTDQMLTLIDLNKEEM